MQPIYHATVIYPKYPPKIQPFKDIAPESTYRTYCTASINSRYNKSFLASTQGATTFDKASHDKLRVMWQTRYYIKPMTHSQVLTECAYIDSFVEQLHVLLTFPKYDIKEMALKRIICNWHDEDRHIVNFIRHKLTNYDYLRRRKVHYFTQVGYFSCVLKIKCLKKMLGNYPYNEEIQRQIDLHIEKIKQIQMVNISDAFYSR